MVRTAALLIALAACASIAWQTRSDGQSHFLATRRYEDIYYLPAADWLKVMSLGHGEAAADLIWLRALVYFGEELGQRGDVIHLYNYADAMLRLDPYFRKVYSWVASCAVYRPGHFSAKDAYKAIEYLEAGARLFPDDGRLAWELGANYLYELVPMLPKGPKRDEARAKGLEHMRVAVLHRAGPDWLALTVAAGFSRLGHTERQAAHLEEVYAQVSDPAVKAQIEAQLTQLRSQTYTEALRHTVEALEARRLREFPYADPGLFLQLGTRPPFDGRALLLRGFDPASEAFEDEAENAGAPERGPG